MINLPFNIKSYLSLDTPEKRKIHLIQLSSIVALIFLLPLSLNALFIQHYNIAFLLFITACMISLNYYYLQKYGNSTLASHMISILFFVLMLYLVYSGGVNATGPLWIFSFPIIVFFLLGLKPGFIYILSFLVLSAIMLFLPFEFLLQTDYPHDYKVRIILSFLLITFLSFLYEYMNTKSFNNMQNLKEELEYSSTRDYLTSLYNRHGYDKYIKSIQHIQGVILMCDIDHFKNINDTYGHDAGDFVLQEVARKIKTILRAEDMAVRWGGEEFFIFLSQTSMDEGYLVAEKIRKSVGNLVIEYGAKLIPVTFSIGIEEISNNISLEDALTNADNAMYIAKKAGRNTISKS